MKKIERILAIIILLLDQDMLTTTELAERFNVTKRTIFRDIETIENAGFPIFSKVGRQGGISLINSFKLRALTFTSEEKNLIIESLSLKEKLLGRSVEPTVIKEKIQILLDNQEPILSNISLSSPTVHRAVVEEHLTRRNKIIETALSRHLKLAIHYIDGKGQATLRIVCPYELGMFNGSWFMQAFCETRQSLRFFKVTRIRKIELLSDSFERIISDKISWPSAKEELIKLEFEKCSLGKIYDYFVEEEMILIKNKVYVTFKSYALADVAAHLLRFGSDVKILAPAKLIKEHQKLVEDLQKIHKK